MKKLYSLLSFLIFLMMGIFTTHAQIIPVSNYSFEIDGNGGTNYGALTDWTVDSSNPALLNYGTKYESPALSAAQDGNNVAFFSLSGDGTNPPANELGWIQQTLTTTFAANTTYTFTAAAGNIAADGVSNTYISLLGTSTTPLASSVPVVPPIYTTGPFADTSLTFDTATDPSVVGQAITLQLDFVSNNQYLRTAYFDNVRLSEAMDVPEPSTWATMLGGLGLLACLHQRKRLA